MHLEFRAHLGLQVRLVLSVQQEVLDPSVQLEQRALLELRVSKEHLVQQDQLVLLVLPVSLVLAVSKALLDLPVQLVLSVLPELLEAQDLLVPPEQPVLREHLVSKERQDQQASLVHLAVPAQLALLVLLAQLV